MPHRYKSQRTATDERAIETLEFLAKGGVASFLRNIHNPNRAELRAKIITEIVATEEKYKQERSKKHPDQVMLRMYEMTFINLVKDHDGISKEPYLVGRYHLDLMNRGCRRTEGKR